MNDFEFFIRKSENMRKGYTASLEKAEPTLYAKLIGCNLKVPDIFSEIYSFCNGTIRDISEQIYFDFLPGYRLMQLDEVIGLIDTDCEDYDAVIPFLEDYAGNHYACALKDESEKILLITDGEAEIIHNSFEDFWKTVIAFYDEGVYYTDEDGFLSYNFDREGEVGAKYNEGISYWEE